MIGQQEKQASLALAGGGMLAGHVLTNLFLRHKLKDPRFLADVFRAGFHHGKSGKQVSSFRTGLFRRIAGPEVPEMYNYARYAGALDRVRASTPGIFNQLMALPESQHQQFLTQLGKKYKRQPEIRDLLHTMGSSQASSYGGGASAALQAYQHMQMPTTGAQTKPLRRELARLRGDMPAIARAAAVAFKREKLNRPLGLTGRFFAGDRPQFMQRLGFGPGAVTAAKPEARGAWATVKRILPESAALGLSLSGLMPGAAAHIVPELAGHATLNMLRDTVARTSIGKRLFGQMLARAKATGKVPPPLLTDVALSPGVTEFLSAAKSLGRLQRAAAPLLPAAQPPVQPVVQPTVPAPVPASPAPIRTGFVGGQYIPHSAALRRKFSTHPPLA